MVIASADEDTKKFSRFLCGVIATVCAVLSVALPTPTGWPAAVDKYIQADAYDYRAKHVCPDCGNVACRIDQHWVKTDGEYGDEVQPMWQP